MAKKRPDRAKPYKVNWSEPQLNGGRKQRQRWFATQAEADLFKAQLTLDSGRRVPVDSTKWTLAEAVSFWLDDIKDRLSPNTWTGYADKVDKAVCILGDRALRTINADLLADLYRHLEREGGVTQRRDKNGDRMARPLSKQSVRHIHVVLSTFFTYAMREKRWLQENPCKMLPRSKVPKQAKGRKTRSLTVDEVFRLIDAAKASSLYPGLETVVRLLFEAGIRRSELCALAADSLTVDADGNPAVHIFRKVIIGHDKKPQLVEATKTHHSNRLVAIDNELATLLNAQLLAGKQQALLVGADYIREPALLLFPGNGFGEPMIPDTLTTRMRNLMKQAGIRNAPFGTHVARHTMGSFLIRDPATDPVTVSRRMGHSRTSTTMDIYGHDDVDTARKAATTAARIFRRDGNKKG